MSLSFYSVNETVDAPHRTVSPMNIPFSATPIPCNNEVDNCLTPLSITDAGGMLNSMHKVRP